MAHRELLFDNLLGDLEYHPKRAMLYLALSTAALCTFIFAPSENKFTVIPLVFGVGGLMLLLKGIFLLRKTSEGLGPSQRMLGLSQEESARPPGPSTRKALPSIPALAAQVVQDFGTGAFLLGPVLNLGKNLDDSWKDLPSLPVFLVGAVLFFIGWIIRRLTSVSAVHG